MEEKAESQNANVRDQNGKNFKYHAKDVTASLWTAENNLRRKHQTLLFVFSSTDSYDRNLYLPIRSINSVSRRFILVKN